MLIIVHISCFAVKFWNFSITGSLFSKTEFGPFAGLGQLLGWVTWRSINQLISKLITCRNLSIRQLRGEDGSVRRQKSSGSNHWHISSIRWRQCNRPKMYPAGLQLPEMACTPFLNVASDLVAFESCNEILEKAYVFLKSPKDEVPILMYFPLNTILFKCNKNCYADIMYCVHTKNSWW